MNCVATFLASRIEDFHDITIMIARLVILLAKALGGP
jgi:hypothetical protein